MDGCERDSRGLGPVFDRPLTRIEMDPVAHGVAVADYVLRMLSEEVRPGPIELTPEFIVDATTRLRQDSAGRASRGVISDIDRRSGSRARRPVVLEGRRRGEVEPGVSHGSKHGRAGSEQDGPPGSEGR